MAYDKGLVARVDDALARLGRRGMRQKSVFSGRGFLAGTTTFVIAWGEGLLVKCPPDEYRDALAQRDVTPFAPGGDRPMGTWVVVAADAIADDPELDLWVERGLRAIGR